MLYIVWLTA